jgi:hypothetical protein
MCSFMLYPEIVHLMQALSCNLCTEYTGSDCSSHHISCSLKLSMEIQYILSQPLYFNSYFFLRTYDCFKMLLYYLL